MTSRRASCKGNRDHDGGVSPASMVDACERERANGGNSKPLRDDITNECAASRSAAIDEPD